MFALVATILNPIVHRSMPSVAAKRRREELEAEAQAQAATAVAPTPAD